MTETKPRLGRGLNALLGEEVMGGDGASEHFNGTRTNLPVEQIQANPYQPRKIFDDEEIAHLSSGVPTLDSALGIGGFPRGQLSHIYRQRNVNHPLDPQFDRRFAIYKYWGK